MSLDTFTEAYVECALWSSSDTNPETGEDVNLDDWDGELTDEARASLEADAKDFYEANHDTWGDLWTDEQAGHDFWLTRNGHGAGFWDRYYGDQPGTRVGKELTDASKAYGSVDLYIGGDGQIHHG